MMPGPTAFVRDADIAFEVAQRELDRGRIKDAIEVLDLAVGVDDANAQLHLLLGVAHVRARQVEHALDHLERALSLDPHAFGPRFALGELYLRLGVPALAREHLDQALALAATAAERAEVQSLLKEERVRARRGVPRPNFQQPFWLLGRRRARARP